MEDATIAQEFYKIRNTWKKIDGKKWDMAIWVCNHHDIDIIDKFMEIEGSPVGMFDDIFFRINTLYLSAETFEEQLWKEFTSWFNSPAEGSLDMFGALKNDGYLDKDYMVDLSLKPTFDSVLKELLRLKENLPLDDESFILYFPPGVHSDGFEKWFAQKMDKGLPKGIRLAVIDPIGSRKFPKIVKHKKGIVKELSVTLHMAAAMKNAMDSDSNETRPHAPSSKFQKQVRRIMEATVNKEMSVITESERLIELGIQLKTFNTKATSYLVSTIAFFSIQEDKPAMEHVEKTLEMTEDDSVAEEAYPIWRSAILLKAALVLVHKDTETALKCYRNLAIKAINKGDVFHVMEAYRMESFLYFKESKNKESWKAAIYSLQAGSNLPLEVRRGSTYLFSAAVALQVAQDADMGEEIIEKLTTRFENTIGEDWKTLLQGTEAIDKKYLNRNNWLSKNKIPQWQ
ncbi:hypothetical protein H0I23_00900 [Cellulophaga sp. HaHaR_3_176]|uniref:hypothetical protein n=1 Tax=Cellulophaga sp. HaHaR_3_176 TaxID=1942464 RepID=UPI001C1FC37A|nr:hypothetical protein [Cellulophaga sp. HaHaR_3_176]QWX84241.1 hypothetical protein H0I23_00900 [Cellulophaga sp. HaHaR_3_176]